MSEQITKQAAPWGQILAKAVAAARTGGQAAGKGLGRYAQLMAGGDKAVLAKPNQMRQAILKVLGKQNAAQERFFAAGTQAAGRNSPLTDRQLVIQKVIARLGKKADKMRQRLIPLDVAANREKELVDLARRTTGNAATFAGAGTLGMTIGSRGEKKEAEVKKAWLTLPLSRIKTLLTGSRIPELERLVARGEKTLGKARRISDRVDSRQWYYAGDAKQEASRAIDRQLSSIRDALQGRRDALFDEKTGVGLTRVGAGAGAVGLAEYIRHLLRGGEPQQPMQIQQKQAEAYLEGFRKMAEAWGVDPQALMKLAQQTNVVQQTNMVSRPATPAQKPRKPTWSEIQEGQRNTPKPASSQPLVPVSGPRELIRNIVNQARRVFL